MSVDDPKPALIKAKKDDENDIDMSDVESAGRYSFVDIDLNDSEEQKLQVQQEHPNTLSIASFKLLRLVGRGAFGRVYLAKNIRNDRIYALKVIKKRALKGNFGLIVSEQEVMKKLVESESDFLLPLEASFHDTENFYLVTVCFFSQIFQGISSPSQISLLCTVVTFTGRCSIAAPVSYPRTPHASVLPNS